ncbi:MAG TPA: thiamine pyrophosphate-binding protein [Pirellulales bacterium]|jgi:benzoylformate decarboxylase|nr:thiamine pyrophosphate-binding protein [Pirellulales bacterium]
MRTTGVGALLQMLADAGVKYLFGNPGTTELPLNDALVDFPRIQYILGLQEIPVMGMADGYAMAARSLGVVNLHISCGLGHAMGILYNAFREGTPLLVTAGQQDRRLKFEEPILYGQMVEVARPWTKWAVEVERIEDLPNALRRAIQIALTPPTGPVFLSLPIDVQMAEAELDLSPAAKLDCAVRPAPGAIRQAAEALLAAKNPAILAGSRVCEADAVAELVTLAEALGAPVISEPGTTHGRLAFPADHPLYAQGLPLWSPEVRQRLHEFDVLFVTGMDLLRQYVYFEPARPIPEQTKLVHLDEDPAQLGKNYPLEVAVLGSTKAGLADLTREIQSRQSAAHREQAQQRSARYAKAHTAARDALRAEACRERGRRPLTPLALMESLARVLPDNVAVIEEAVTTTNTVFERLGALRNTTGYFGHRGWALGWGLGVALGVKLAWPDRPVLALLGEGAAMYGIQGLWSAARYQIPVTFVICNNAQYQILKIGAGNLGLPQAEQGRYLGLDLAQPEIDFVGLAQALGVEAQTITDPDELERQVVASLAGNRPRLFNVPIARETPRRLNYG